MRFWLSCALGFAVLLIALVWAFGQWNLRYYTNYIGDRLELLAELRRGAVEQYFATAQAELRFWSKNDRLLGIQQQLNETWQASTAEEIAEIFRLYVETFVGQWNNLYLLNTSPKLTLIDAGSSSMSSMIASTLVNSFAVS